MEKEGKNEIAEMLPPKCSYKKNENLDILKTNDSENNFTTGLI